MKLSTWRAMAAALGVAQGAMVACGGSGGAGGDGGASSSSTIASSSSSGSSAGAECATMPTKQMCFDCCGMDLPAAYDKLVLDIVAGCACDMSGGGMPPCASDMSCQMDCQTMMPSGACLLCFNTQAIDAKHPCVAASYMACQSDPSCSPMLDCNVRCKQAM